MKVRIYNGKTLDFPQLRTVQERIDYIVDNIFNDKELAKYYNPISDSCKGEVDESHFEKFEDNWLGIKVVGKKDKQEHMKSFLDYLTGYILNAKNYSQNSYYREFYNLAYKDELAEWEVKRFNELKKLVIYADITKESFNKSTILLRNTEFENLMKERLEELRKNQEDDYTKRFMINDLESRLLMCDSIIEEVKEMETKVKQQSNLVKKCYDNFKNNTKNSNRSEVVRIARLYVKEKNELDWLKISVSRLVDEYRTLTELQQNISK